MPPPERRRVVLDADINWKLSRELRRRHRDDATSLHEQRLDGLKDGALIKALATGDFEPFVLVTWDNAMAKAHRAELDHFGTTLATINRKGYDDSISEESYTRDVVHRRLHLIEVQPPRSVIFWTPRGRSAR